MFSRHVSRYIPAYLDGQLAEADARRTELHLNTCARCRTECDEVKRGRDLLLHVPPIEAPASIWSSIERVLEQSGSGT
ncbi:MAG: zf-HC2 domain-containing protein, partial [Acidobacteriaceae bacterium]|nr:zf-HC2 domain-containing protein [Acidobacteriaceae bacterium]